MIIYLVITPHDYNSADVEVFRTKEEAEQELENIKSYNDMYYPYIQKRDI